MQKFYVYQTLQKERESSSKSNRAYEYGNVNARAAIGAWSWIESAGSLWKRGEYIHDSVNETDEKESARLLPYRFGAGRRSLLATGHVILYVGHRRYQRFRSSIPSLLAIMLSETSRSRPAAFAVKLYYGDLGFV